MTVTDTEKLQRLREYINGMAPIVRIALLLDDETMAYNRGWDAAALTYQQDLLRILDG